MADSILRRLKKLLLARLGLSPDAILAFAGLACFLATCLLFGRPLSWAWALLPGLCFALLLEGLEIIDHYGPRGFLALGPARIANVVLRHCRDVLVINLGPLMVWAVAAAVG